MSAVAQKQLTWPDVIDQAAPKFNEIATQHKLVTWAEESQFAKQAIESNEKLAGCLVHTVQNAIINVAAVGLTLNPALGYAYLVPEGTKQPDGKWKDECKLRVSFKGLLKIATDSGSILWAKAEVVKEKDTFEYRGPCEKPSHVMNPFGDRGETVGVYCIAKTHQGDYLVDIMDANEIAKIRNAAKTKNVWDAWPDEMAKKAIIKRASKQWPKTEQSERLDHAIAVVNEYEGSEPIQPERQEREVNPAAMPITAEQAEELRKALTVAGISEQAFCNHRSINIAALTELPSARYEGALRWLKQQAVGSEQ